MLDKLHTGANENNRYEQNWSLEPRKNKTRLKKQVKLVQSYVQMNCIVDKRPCSNMLSFDLNEMEI